MLLESTLISIITVTFNNLNGLKKTIESCSHLNPCPLELIIIDGGSTDGSSAYLESIKQIPTFSIKIHSEKDSGIYDAMNKGVKIASGEWIVFMNAGDTFYEDDSFKKVEDLLQNKNISAFYGDSEISYPHFSRIQKALPTNFWKSIPFVHQSFYCKRELLIQYPFNTNYKLCADYDFYIWLVSSGKNIQKTDIILSNNAAGGKSDVMRAKASMEKLAIYNNYYPNSGFSISLFFYLEYGKGIVSIFIKRILPNSFIEFITKLKYRNH